MHPLRYQPTVGNPLPPPPSRSLARSQPNPGMTRSRSAMPAVTGEVLAVDARSGTGTVRVGSTGQIFQFSLGDVTGDLSKVVKGGIITGLLMGDRVCGVAVVRGPQVGACDNPKLREDPPFFVMKWNFEEMRKMALSNDTTEIPVVLVDNRANLLIAISELVLAEKVSKPVTIGVDVVPGLNQGKPVLCLCLSTCVIVIELSLLEEADGLMFAHLFIGFIHRINKCPSAISFASVADHPLMALASGYPQWFPETLLVLKCTNILPPSAGALENLVDSLFQYRMEPLDQVNDLASMAFHLGRNCFHARQILIESKRPVTPPVKEVAPASIYRQLPATAAIHASQKRMREASVPVRSRTAPTAFELPPPSPISDDAPAEESTLAEEGEVSVGASMADLLERVRASKRQQLAPPVEEENASRFLQWFDEDGQRQNTDSE